jgi:DNA-binding MarR family transcriptional regulator
MAPSGFGRCARLLSRDGRSNPGAADRASGDPGPVTGFARVPAPLSFDPIAEAARQWRRHWGPRPVPAMAAVTSIMRVEQILTARLNGLLKPWKLTFPRYEALMLLYYSRTGSLPLGKMGARLQVHPTSVTNTIDGLEKLGLVVRSRHESDRRTTLATLTDEGRAVAEAATAVLNRDGFGTQPLAKGDLEALFEMLRAVRADADDFE